MDMFDPLTSSTRLTLKKFQSSKLTIVEVAPDILMTELKLLRKHLKTLKVNI
jgi:hypothetical protein